MPAKFTLKKNERLKSRKQIEELFSQGKKINFSPLLLYYSFAPAGPPLQMGAGVSSKFFKKSVDRNRIKRLIKEAYRLQKIPLQIKLKERNTRLNVFFIYTAKAIPAYETIFNSMNHVLNKLLALAEKNPD
jgi:ribonuclease P protein component